MGEGVAIPHGTLAGKDAVRRDALASALPRRRRLGRRRRHASASASPPAATGTCGSSPQLAEILVDPDQAAALREATEVDEVITLILDGEDAS